MASVGKYNETYFKNHPEEAQKEGVLYGVILVNKKTHEREIIKVGSVIQLVNIVSEPKILRLVLFEVPLIFK